MRSILDVPYVGQVGYGANLHGNDCGAASAAMIISYAGVDIPSVDDLYDEVKPSGDSYLSVGDLLALLSHRNIKADWDANFETKDLFWILTKSTPTIALIRYGALESIRPNNFKGSHFVVVVGMDLDTVYIHDPLNTPTDGECVGVPMRMFETAWSTVGDNNPQRSMIIPALTPNAPVVTDVVLKYVYPRDKDGLNVRKIPGDLSDYNKLYAIPYGVRIAIYAERDGWGKIQPKKEEWISMEYTKV